MPSSSTSTEGTEPFRSRASESANRSRANSLLGPFAPWPFHSLELSRRVYIAIHFLSSKFLGHFAPGSESSRERIGQGAVGRFAPGSELARERKGCESVPSSWLCSWDWYFAECGLRNAESCQGVICGKSSAERSTKYPLSLFRIPQPKNSAFPHHSLWSYLLTIWLDIATYFNLWCRGMFRFGYLQYMFTLHVVDYITFICV